MKPLPTLIVLLVLFAAGCACPLQGPAENLTQTVLPEHRAYVQADESLSPEQRDVRLDLLDEFERTVRMNSDRPESFVPAPAPRE